MLNISFTVSNCLMFNFRYLLSDFVTNSPVPYVHSCACALIVSVYICVFVISLSSKFAFHVNFCGSPQFDFSKFT